MGSAHTIDLARSLNKRSASSVLQDYSLRDAEQRFDGRGAQFKPIFADYNDAVIFGSIDGHVLVWDRRRGQVVHEMDHGTGETSFLSDYTVLKVQIQVYQFKPPR